MYEYVDDDSLSLGRKPVPVRARKEILKAVLEGIADLHDRSIVHLGKFISSALHTVNTNDQWSLDLKPDNILVNYCQFDEDITVQKMQISDLENAAYLPRPRCIKGMLPGNDNWRSP